MELKNSGKWILKVLRSRNGCVATAGQANAAAQRNKIQPSILYSFSAPLRLCGKNSFAR
jgi:hypothetical protein